MHISCRILNICQDGINRDKRKRKPQSIDCSFLLWYPRAESNRQRCFRRALLYPFNYEDMFHEYYIITHRKKYQLKEQMLFYRSNRLNVVIVGKV